MTKFLLSNTRAARLAIPYDRVNSLEYGQKAGRRVGVAIMVSPIALLSKKRKHFVTLSYLDESDKQQAAVFELGKDVVRVTLATWKPAQAVRLNTKTKKRKKRSRKLGEGHVVTVMVAMILLAQSVPAPATATRVEKQSGKPVQVDEETAEKLLKAKRIFVEQSSATTAPIEPYNP